MEASANVTREEFNTAIGDISAKMEALMTTMSQLVQGAAPTAGDGRESRGGRHTAPGSDQGGLDRAPNTREAPSWQRHRAASSVGNAYVNPTSSRTPRLRQLNFDGREENWSMFHNDFLTQVHACGMMSYF